jgi:signal transduction histidine kinase
MDEIFPLNSLGRFISNWLKFPVVSFWSSIGSEMVVESSYSVPGNHKLSEINTLLNVLRNYGKSIITDIQTEGELSIHPAVIANPEIHFSAFISPNRHENPSSGMWILDTKPHDCIQQDKLELLNELAGFADELIQQTSIKDDQATTPTESFTQALHEIASMLNKSLDLDEVLDRIPALIERVVPHDTASIILVENNEAIQIRNYGPIPYPTDAKEIPHYRIDEIPSLRIMTDSKEPLVIADTKTSKLWVEKPHLDWVRSYLGAPIQSEEQVIGFLNLNSAKSGFYTKQHARRLQAFADQAAVALKNARLFEQAQTAAALEERQRLARELHDAVSQSLWTASIIAEVLPTLWEKDRREARRSLRNLHRLTQGALAEMRTLLHELRPSALIESSLDDLLEQLVLSTMSQRNLEITLEIKENCRFLNELPNGRTLSPEIRVGIYRIAQEALNNIVKHSRAHRVKLSLSTTAAGLRLMIHDDGLGFDQAKIKNERLGLAIMQERASAISASVEILSTPGRGTQIQIDWPDPDKTRVMEEFS